MDNVIDLDILRPDVKNVKLAGKMIDVSFVPCGVTFEVDSIVRELTAFTKEELESNEESANRAFVLSVKLCSTFAITQYPGMTEEWFMKNTSPAQINAFAASIQDALVASYKGLESYGKN